MGKSKVDDSSLDQEKIDWILVALFFALCAVIGYAIMRFL
jgi:hypothetical protein